MDYDTMRAVEDDFTQRELTDAPYKRTIRIVLPPELAAEIGRDSYSFDIGQTLRLWARHFEDESPDMAEELRYCAEEAYYDPLDFCEEEEDDSVEDTVEKEDADGPMECAMENLRAEYKESETLIRISLPLEIRRKHPTHATIIVPLREVLMFRAAAYEEIGLVGYANGLRSIASEFFAKPVNCQSRLVFDFVMDGTWQYPERRLVSVNGTD